MDQYHSYKSSAKSRERCFYTRLYKHVGDEINNAQREFISGRSCALQLFGTLRRVGELLDQNVQTDESLSLTS